MRLFFGVKKFLSCGRWAMKKSPWSLVGCLGYKRGWYYTVKWGVLWTTIWGFLKWWYPTTMGFPTKNDHFGVFWGYHHLRKHPYGSLLYTARLHWFSMTQMVLLDLRQGDGSCLWKWGCLGSMDRCQGTTLGCRREFTDLQWLPWAKCDFLLWSILRI